MTNLKKGQKVRVNDPDGSFHRLVGEVTDPPAYHYVPTPKQDGVWVEFKLWFAIDELVDPDLFR
jgi:hypothetical protein